jgi:hypothetical protein
MFNEEMSVKPTVPRDILELKVQPDNTSKVLTFLFGGDSLPCHGIHAWLQALNARYHHFQVCTTLDNKSIASIVMIIHNRIQLFLSSCAQATNPDNVDMSLLDFTDVIRHIITGDFAPVLLLAIIEQAAAKENAPPPSDSPDDKKSPPNDKKRLS